MTFPSNCNHNYFDGACLECGKETPEYDPRIQLILNKTEIKQLYDCLSKQYISHEFHPAVIQLVRRLSSFISETE